MASLGVRIGLLLGALGTALFGVVPAPSDAAAPLCRPAGAKALVTSMEGTVYRAGRSRDTTRYVACHGRRTKPIALGGADCFNAQAPSRFAIAGRWLAYVSLSCDTVSGSETVIVVDLRTRKRRYQSTATSTPAAAADVYAGVERLLVVRAGDVAWIASYVPAQGQPRVFEVRRSTPTRNVSALLDSGTDVLPDSLAVSPDLVYWMRGAAPRSAPLR